MDFVLNSTALDFARQLAVQGRIADGWWPFDPEQKKRLLGDDGDDWESYGKVHLGIRGDGQVDGEESFAFPIAQFYGGDLVLSVQALIRARHQAGMEGLSEIFNAADYLLSLAVGQQAYFTSESEAARFVAQDDGGFWVEIFRAGTWTSMEGHTRTYTREDLEQIVAAFKALEEDLTVPLRLGDHDEDPEADAKMAYGWVSDLKVEDDVLLGYFTHVPDKLKDAFKEKRYRKVSVGLWFNWKYDGTTYPVVLNHVAVLGAMQPAVKGLKDLDAYMGDGLEVHQFTFTEEGEEMKELEQMRLRAEQAEAKLAAAEKESEQLKSELDDLRKRVAEFEEKAARDQVTSIVEAACKEGRCLPANKDAEVELGLMAMQASASFSGEEGKSPFDAWKKRLAEGPKVVDFSDKSASGGGDEGGKDFWQKQYEAGVAAAKKASAAAVNKDQD